MFKYSIADWKLYFNNIGLKEELSAQYVDFLGGFFEKGIPPIFEHEHLALLLATNVEDLLAKVASPHSFYRIFRIKKRAGGFRQISAPYPSLLMHQRWINNKILSKVTLSKCATGYRSDYSILDNAKLHCGRDTLIKLDLKDFFPSIEFRRVMSVFIELGYPDNVAYFLSKICTLAGELPQGAASSPALSNIISRKMDYRFYELCRQNRLRYTRYADDISISGKSIPNWAIRLFFEIIRDEGFVVNEEKTRFLTLGDKKIVTGLDITSGTPRVPRRFRRELQKDVYFVWSAGLATHVSRRKLFVPNYIEQLNGRVQFWASIEPSSNQMKKTRRRVQQLKELYQK